MLVAEKEVTFASDADLAVDGLQGRLQGWGAVCAGEQDRLKERKRSATGEYPLLEEMVRLRCVNAGPEPWSLTTHT